MKKKLTLSLLTFFVFSVLTLNVNATLLEIPIDTDAQAPVDIPKENSQLYAALTEKFDFSKIKFTVDGNDNEYIAGHTNMQKIILTESFDTTKSGLAVLGDKWFTAYCLDGDLKYPQYGYFNSAAAVAAEALDSGKTEEDKLKIYILAALLNNSGLYDALEKAKGYSVDPVVDYTISGGKDAKTTLEDLRAGKEITIDVQKVTYHDLRGGQLEIPAKDLAKSDVSTYTLKFKLEDAVLDKYTTTKMNDRTYDHALWILEHSYPTMPLNTSLDYAGVDSVKLKEELKTLDKSINDGNIDGYLKNYVYSTIQYSIWKVYDGINNDGKKLGNTLVGSEELNKLYQFLIKDREEYNGYSTLNFTNKLNLEQPASGKEIFKETDSAYTYGPYKASYDVLSGGNVELTITNANKDGIKIVDENGTVINQIEPNKPFYIECNKKEKIANVSIKLTLKGASAFEPATNRGRIYYALYPLAQNVMSGGKIVNLDLEKSFDLVYNPKTGVENVAVLLLITLVAFSLAYLVLSYKSKSVEL